MIVKARFIVAEYIRLSREDGDKTESDSISNQRRLIADYLNDKQEFTCHDTYVDDGYTGTNFNRPEFQRMIADIEAKKINCVIVKDLSRFGRDYIDTGRYLERYFPDHDIRFIAITDGIDSFRQEYDMLLPIKNIFNEQYARDISHKIHASVSTKQKAGDFIGAFPSYGYQKSPIDKNKLIIDEYAASVVRQVFDLYLAGYGKLRIASILNEQGIICPSEYKKNNGDNYRNSHKLDSTTYWTYSTINRLLQNEMYIGNMVQGRKIQQMRGKPKVKSRNEWIVVKNTHEAIIEIAKWEKTQDLLNRRARTPKLDNPINIFAGFIKCGDCGRSMIKKAANYYCGTYVRSGRQYCSSHPLPESILEKTIINDLQALLHSIDDLPELIEQNREKALLMTKEAEVAKASGQELNRLNAELDRTRKYKKAIYEDLCEELISKEEYLAYRKEYLEKEALLTSRLEHMQDQRNREIIPDQKQNPWTDYLMEHKAVKNLDRSIVMEMIHGIAVFEDNMVRITYRYSNILIERKLKK